MSRRKSDASSASPKARRGLVHTPVAAVVGLLALAVIGIDLIRGGLDLAAAGERAGVVLAVAIAIDHLIAPVVRALLPAARRELP